MDDEGAEETKGAKAGRRGILSREVACAPGWRGYFYGVLG